MELTIEQALQQGVAAHKEGKLQDAERLYRAILQSQPTHSDANHNLGVLAVSVNKADAALMHLSKQRNLMSQGNPLLTQSKPRLIQLSFKYSKSNFNLSYLLVVTYHSKNLEIHCRVIKVNCHQQLSCVRLEDISRLKSG